MMEILFKESNRSKLRSIQIKEQGGIMKKIAAFWIILIVLVGCSQSPAAIQSAIAKTQTAMPSNTPTPTPIPLSEINLENSLLLKGDLPEGYVVEPFEKDISGTIFKNIKGIDNVLLQRFSKEGEGGGTVAVLLFENIDNLNQAYDDIIKNELESTKYTGKSELDDVGEKGYVYYQQIYPDTDYSINFVTFVRCHAFVYMVKTMGGKETTVLRAYAKKLDERLTELVCP